jgi:hypothetical protein
MESSRLMVGLAVASLALAQDAEQSILTHRQSASKVPNHRYVLQFKAGTGALLLYGARHTHDVKDPQIAEIERMWVEFHPTVAYNEGRDAQTLDDPAEALQWYDEPGFVRYLAGRDRVPAATMEPPLDAEISYALALKTYSAVQVKVYYALLQVALGGGSIAPASADEQMRNTLSRLAHHGLNGPPNTLEELAAECKRLFPKLADWHKVPEDWFDPVKKCQYTNDLTDAISLFRDKHIFHVLVERAKRGDRVFAVVGLSHVIAQEPALRQALGDPELTTNGLL